MLLAPVRRPLAWLNVLVDDVIVGPTAPGDIRLPRPRRRHAQDGTPPHFVTLSGSISFENYLFAYLCICLHLYLLPCTMSVGVASGVARAVRIQ